MRAHLVPVAAGFLVGILAADGNVSALAAAAVIVLAALALPGSPGLRAAVIAAVAAGTVDATWSRASEPVGDRHAGRIAWVVADARTLDDGATDVTLRASDGTQASLYLRDAAPEIGTRLVVIAKREPFDRARNPGEPAERDLEAARGRTWRLVHARIVARAPPDERDASLWIPRVRAWASTRIHALLGEPDATMLAGALWGERGSLPPDLRAEFQDTGTVHVLVTAGLHLGVVAALALAVLGWCGMGRVAGSLATIPLIWAYAALSGDHVPSVRAATMLSFALLARASGRDTFSPNALAAAAIVVAALRPASVATLSFALSFSCVAAILAFARPCARALARLGIGGEPAAILGVAVATQLGTWPLTASGFLVIAPYAPLANAAVVPVVGIAMLAGFAALALSPLGWPAHAVANVDAALLAWIRGVVGFVAGLPGAHVVATPPPPWTIVSYDLALAFAALAGARGHWRRGCVAIACAAALCLWPPRTPSHDLVVTAIDVGQADALAILTPNGHAYLVDAGGRLERGGAGAAASSAEAIGERVVVPFLIRSGVHHLDAVLLSHPHGDHAGGMPAVLRILGTNGFADSGQAYPGHAYHDALAIAHATHVPLLEPRGGDLWRTDDGVTFRFYGPTAPYITGSRSDINSNSLVFRLEYGTFTMLFMGDAGTETEARLLANGDDLRADVLKVGHHGSAYGTTPAFVRAVAPRYAIVSVGRHNLFGHPAPVTLDTLRNAGADVYRTDENGAVTITSDGTAIHVDAQLVAEGFLLRDTPNRASFDTFDASRFRPGAP